MRKAYGRPKRKEAADVTSISTSYAQSAYDVDEWKRRNQITLIVHCSKQGPQKREPNGHSTRMLSGPGPALNGVVAGAGAKPRLQDSQLLSPIN